MATYQEAYNCSLEYFNGDELAADVFVTKYALTDSQGDIKELTPDGMHRRLSKEFARIEKKYKDSLDEETIYELFKHFKYIIPQGSPMSAIGNDYQIQSVGNCFVVEDVFDSYGGILYSDQQLAQLMKRRAGVGIDISNLRPKGAVTKNAAKTTDGISIFMERFSNTCREVAQGGRRGALMITCDVHHPEIEAFINIKNDRKKVTGANISVKFSNEFLNAVENNQEYEQRWPKEKPTIIKKVNAKKIWDLFISSAWKSAEPGSMYWDLICSESPSHLYGIINHIFYNRTTNPCGELPLGLDSCRLMAINLYSYVKDPFTEIAKFDWKLYYKHVIIAQKLMDDLIDLEIEKIDKILEKIEFDSEPKYIKQVEKDTWLQFRSSCKIGRRTGLGITALGDCMAALGIKYGSKKSIEITESIYRNLAMGSYESSILMARDRGSFPIWNYQLEKDHIYINRIISNLDKDTQSMYLQYGRRNIANTTTAPTGSVSLMTQTSSGIEPVYKLSYKRRKKISQNENTKVDFIDGMGDKWSEYNVYHHKLKDWMDITGNIDIALSPYHNSTANEIDWLTSIEMQAKAQKWIDHSISKTCNLPKDITKEQVSEIYMKAWKLGCKGFTIYREGSRDGVLMANEEENEKFIEHPAPKRLKELLCDIHQVSIKGEAWTLFVGKYENKPYEIFGGLSKYISIPKKYKQGKLAKSTKKSNGSSAYDVFYGEGEDTTKIHDIVDVFENPTHGAFTRTISLSLRHGCPVHYLVEQLQKDDKESDMYSFSKVMARVLKHYIEDRIKHSKLCGNSDCKSQNSLEYKEGCLTCMSCGWSKC